MSLLKTKYQKYYALPELYVQQANISFNFQCNAKCSYCYCNLSNERYMSLEKAKEVANVVYDELRIKDVYISTQAEATIWPHLSELMLYINSLHIPHAYTTIDTNGRFIPDGLIELANVSSNVLWSVNVSLAGYDEESWQKYSGKGNWELFLENCRKYLSMLKTAPSFSIISFNEEQTDKAFAFVKDLCESCGKSAIELNNGNAADQYSYKANGIIPVNVRKLVKKCSDGLLHSCERRDSTKELDFVARSNCDLLLKELIVDGAGFVYPCSGVAGMKGYAIGNINNAVFTKEAFFKMLNTKRAKKMWEENFTPHSLACNYCKQCWTRNAF